MANPTTPSAAAPDPTKYYYIKSRAHPAGPPTKYANRYLRYTSGGHSDTVLTTAHPVFLRFYMDRDGGKQLARFQDRVWGVVMSSTSTTDPADAAAAAAAAKSGLWPVRMFEDGGEDGFYLDVEDGGKLNWRGGRKSGVVGGDGEWEGWVVRETPPDRFQGNPQLFWMGRAAGVDLPDGVERVELFAEYLEGESHAKDGPA